MNQTPSGWYGKDARPADLAIEQAADGQGVVADHLGVQAEAAARGDSRRLNGSRRASSAVSRRRLPIGRRGDDQLVHRLQAPFPLDELDGQPVEQFRVGRRFALGAEVLARLDEAAAEEARPEPIHRHAAGQRVVRVDQPAGQAQAVGRLPGRQRVQLRRHAGLDRLAEVLEVAAEHDVRRPRLRQLLHHQRRRPA